MLASHRRYVRGAVPIALLLVAPACKGSRSKLEQLVPDGATGIMSVDPQPMLKSDSYAKLMALAKDSDPKVGVVLDQLEGDCKLDYLKMESYVAGFDALSQGFVLAMRMPNIGTKDSLSCVADLIKENTGDSPMTFGEEDGKLTIDVAGGEAKGWATDDNTIVFSSKGWASAVQQRIKGEGKSAVDNYLKDAVALADKDAHVWLAGKMPAIAKPFLAETPGKGLDMGAASMRFGDDLEFEMTVVFEEAGQASDLEAEINKQLGELKPMAIEQGVPTEVFDSLSIEADGAKLTGKIKVPFARLVEETTKSFTKYVRRSKTSEARVNLAKMFDATSAYFNEEHVSRGEVAVLGGGGAAGTDVRHMCPYTEGAKIGKGSSGIVPPLSVDCSKGPDGKCVPVPGGSDKPGHYAAELWTDNNAWNGLNFQMEQPHYYHYAFRYENGGEGFGQCQFTAQAFGDLDGDGVFSTYERTGAADQNGLNAAAGLYIDQETE